jgi:hypothetical protein
MEYTHDLLDINRARIAADKLLCHQHHGTDGSTFCEDCQEEEDGYDLSPGETKMGEASIISFTADKAGDFEIESHVTEDVLVIIRVK